MKKRESRMHVIKSIILSNEVGSQEELLQLLEADRFVITQATLSRDLKLLKVAKSVNSNGRYVYTLPVDKINTTSSSVAEPFNSRGFISLQFSLNIAVIRTMPGYASSMAYHIDNQSNPNILGTIAGDDTIMLVLREGIDHQVIRDNLSDILSTIQ